MPNQKPFSIERLNLLGFALDDADLKMSVEQLLIWLKDTNTNPTKTVVTLNPEIIVQAQTNESIRQVINQSDLVTADGVGIVWAAKRLLGKDLRGRATGVDVSVALMEQLGKDLRVYFLGAKPGVAELAAKNCVQRFGIQVAGFRDGYFDASTEPQVVEAVRQSNAELLLTGLGGGVQETLNTKWRDALGAKVAIGVGGTIDVLAGATERAPAWTSKLGVEWVWRISTMRRWARAKRLLDFVVLVLRGK